MRKIHHNIWFVCMAVAMLLSACTDNDGPTVKDEPTVVYPEIHLGVSEMTMTAVSRAAEPMSPDVEKYVRTIAVFEFDNEGIHDKDPQTYHFIDFVAGTVDDKTGVGDVVKTDYGIVETTLKGIAFKSYTDGTICLVANVTEDQVKVFYDECKESGQSYGRMTLDQFKKWALPFEYEQAKEGTYDETTAGHIKVMYMFGYYQGNIDPDTSGEIRVDLGRLASRLDITVVNDTGEELTKRLGYHFDNVCKSAYFFPIKMGMPPTIGAGLTRTIICSGKNDPVEGVVTEVPETFKPGESHTRYFYVAAHSATGKDDATQLHLFYDRRIVNDNVADNTGSVKVPLCNVHPSEADNVPNGYSLSRNTRYHFTIRLKKSTASPANAPASRSVEYGEQPGEIVVYLP